MSEVTQTRAMDDYFHSLLIDDLLLEEELPPELAPQSRVATQAYRAPYVEVEDERLAQLSSLLAQVSKVQVEMETLSQETAVEPFALASQVEALPEAEVLPVATEALLVEAQPQYEPAPVALPVEAVQIETATELAEIQPSEAEPWQNIEMGNEFQALFFEVAGVTFAVPLMELGGIHQLGEVSALFGQPKWYRGIMTQREQQMSVVDTALWVMPEKELEVADYHYLIMLGESNWGLACHHLRGTELLRRDQVKWRHQEGKRPWLAGMVKEKMCALLHVRELLVLLARGVNITGH
ncbi:purine-binding chemotaxis protein CheW [Aeromonas sp. BIGb0405]|jgi:purine-binding chemotaxis protein CheW|uniref:chemotaxis protein CheW n=1 Tax=Aeromonas sp. BIGb0405 TaxID=2940592 RepID=UPI0021684880|nr:chemotaxis protein CheW [Aeromonas sp. BIGb0405]MCS3455352.1 purine-binding chemotaxis protein CheW [Aeromonas sp. BIGb0405]